jgi:pyruvate/2-oxoglutarate dehydrogenase complex dihydrolipoamide dehydrogenase (E3) component
MPVEAVKVVPDDRHNRELVANAHPGDWINPQPEGRYNLVVIGAGTAGLVAAAGAAALGAKVALVERHLMGGDCLNVGCVPSKGLIRAGRASADVRDSGEFGIRVPEGTTVDFPAVMERMRRLRAKISPNDSAKRFAEMGIDVYLGEGHFLPRNRVEVDGKELEYAKAVIATGARASAPPIPGLAEAGYLTNETLFSLTELPRRIAVIGAGPIGCEMTQALSRFGAEMTLLELAGQVMPRELSHFAAILQSSLEKDGVNLITGCKTTKIEAGPSGKVVHFDVDGESRSVEVDEILVSVGRSPNVEGLGLDVVGVEIDPGVGVKVNKYLQTTNKRIYAAGDICFPYKFTHTAEALAAIVIQNALFARTKKTDGLIVPWSTYTEPEIAHVGLFPEEARKRGVETDTFTCSFDDVDRAILDGEENGIVEIYAKKGSDKIVGATIAAKHAGDMISEISLAMTGGLGLGTIAATIHPYPSQADAIRKAAKAFYKTRLTPRVKNIMVRWMKWRR